MIASFLYRIRIVLMPGAFFLLATLAVSVHSMDPEIRLTPPGLRLIKDPSVVVPAGYHYTNRPIKLPAYCNTAGNALRGWAAKFVDTRRFASDQSAWIFYRTSDLKSSVFTQGAGGRIDFRLWPVGTTIVIEIYKGSAPQRESAKLIEIAAMAKINAREESFHQAFYPVNWVYSRFTPKGYPSTTAANIRECHQCHSIAFHYTGDLVFTRFP